MNHTLTPEASARGRTRSLAVRQRKAVENAEAVRWVLGPLADTDMTLAEIAAVLNERRIRSPRGGRWHPENVKQTLKRLGLYAVAEV